MDLRAPWASREGVARLIRMLRVARLIRMLRVAREAVEAGYWRASLEPVGPKGWVELVG